MVFFGYKRDFSAKLHLVYHLLAWGLPFVSVIIALAVKVGNKTTFYNVFQ